MAENFVGKVVIQILKALCFLLWFQPRKLQLFWGKALGDILYIFKFKYSVVNQNLLIAFPHDEQKRKDLIRKSYFHFGNLILEILFLFGPMKQFIHKYAELIGHEHIYEAKKRGKGLIFLSSHVGNWEVMAGTSWIYAQTELMLVTKQLKPAWLHKVIEKTRLKYGVSATYEPRTMRDVLKNLKNNGAVGFVLDQYAGPPVGIRVPLFGVPVGTAMAVAAIVKRTGTTVLPVVNYRTPEGRYVIEVCQPLKWEEHSNSHYELALNTAEYTKFIEKSILAHPEQWLWNHRRFKGDLSPLRQDEWMESRMRI